MLSEKEQVSDATQFWQFLHKHFKQLLIYAIVGALMASIITLFIPKEFKSYGIVYPPSSTSFENSIDFPNFGYDVEADRLMQIFESREIRDSVVKKFELVKYFEIDRESPEWHDELLKKYFKNIKFERTTSMAVLISVRTKDPNLSASIVNYIINSADAFREKLYKKNINTAYENALEEYTTQKLKVDSVEAILVEELKQNKLSSLLMLISDAQISIDIDKLNSLNAATTHTAIGGHIIAFKSIYDVLRDSRSRLIRIKKTYTNPIPKIYVINYAEPYFKKVSPSFLVNIAIGILLSLSVAGVILLVKHNREHS
ncbi:MAG: hypothetical protein PSX36_11005 [bacterium]|nr:hypothetical protein [bacterium]